MHKFIRLGFVNVFVIAIAGGMAWAGSQNGVTISGGLPVFAVGIALAFIINWIAFIPAYILQTEKFFDLTGSVTYISVTLICTFLSPVRDIRTTIVIILVLIWAIRLGTFLFTRIHKEGKDGRFDELKPSFLSFFTVWNLQGLWVALTMPTALVVITSASKVPTDAYAYVGLAIWIMGFSIEVLADFQKSKWRTVPGNKSKFIDVGLWSYSRHPNYLGEIIIWLGMAMIAFPVLLSWQYFALVSPVFVYILLTHVSGINLLEERADKKWGGQKDYENYKKKTPILFPKWG